MADEVELDAAGDSAVELRPCAFCGHSIHPSSHLCTHCGGHVGLAWGTVHKELFLFLFLAVMVVVGCLASWTGRTRGASPRQLEKAQAKAEERARQETIAKRLEVEKRNTEHRAKGEPLEPVPEAVVAVPVDSDVEEWDTVEPAGREINGLDTIRGALMLAIAVYGLFVGVFNLLYRRLVMWPFVISGMLALWVGLSGVISASKSAAWERWATWAAKHSLDEQVLGKFRAVPPGFILLTLAGVILLVKLVGGILAVATKGKPGADGGDDAASRRRKKDDAAPSGGAPADAAPTAPK